MIARTIGYPITKARMSSAGRVIQSNHRVPRRCRRGTRAVVLWRLSSGGQPPRSFFRDEDIFDVIESTDDELVIALCTPVITSE